MNLNETFIRTDSEEQPLADYGIISESATVEVVFKNLKDRLLSEIRRSTMVLGCVAWLTDLEIIDALAELPMGAAIVVQKEDFLRPDINSKSGWRNKLRERYGRIRPKFSRCELPGLVGDLSVSIDHTIQGVRCVGNHNADKAPAFPRMHNKFIVFCHLTTAEETRIQCTRVWTGSFNFTANASASLENAVLIYDRNIAHAYFQEWSQITALSEPLDWESQWIAPEWRIGT